MPTLYFRTVLLLLLLLSSACSNPKIQTQADTALLHARLTSAAAVMSDGYVLPMKTWGSSDETTAVVLAMHGFNDYSNAFDAAAHSFANDLITTYAIDQRGFGATQQHGVWAGQAVMHSDLIATVDLLCEKHPGLPVFLLGESMGGAVILSAVQQLEATCVQGVILMAPAVWGWQAMPWWQTVPLRLLAHTLPELTVTGDGLDIRASDNDEMLRALGRDPLVIKETRIDSIYGLTDLMEAAMENSGALKMPALILYGENDEIIPSGAFCRMLDILPDRDTSHWRLILYPDGYHMLTRDLQAEVVIQDIKTWIRDQKTLLPSGQEVVEGDLRLSVLNECDGLQQLN
ncbi:MAG: lysophospholipase [Gammaproteobacteria bacterium]|nr:lysophospholipase [Gammaproteobacteria bacterium]